MYACIGHFYNSINPLLYIAAVAAAAAAADYVLLKRIWLPSLEIAELSNFSVKILIEFFTTELILNRDLIDWDNSLWACFAFVLVAFVCFIASGQVFLSLSPSP